MRGKIVYIVPQDLHCYGGDRNERSCSSFVFDGYDDSTYYDYSEEHTQRSESVCSNRFPSMAFMFRLRFRRL
jgi:hypothetical protein